MSNHFRQIKTTSGSVERMGRTWPNKCFRMRSSKLRQFDIDEIQRDLERLMRYFNLERSH